MSVIKSWNNPRILWPRENSNGCSSLPDNSLYLRSGSRLRINLGNKISEAHNSSAFAAWRRWLGENLAYTLRVISTLEWAKNWAISSIGTPASAIHTAAECLKTWGEMKGRLIFLATALIPFFTDWTLEPAHSITWVVADAPCALSNAVNNWSLMGTIPRPLRYCSLAVLKLIVRRWRSTRSHVRSNMAWVRAPVEIAKRKKSLMCG